MAPVSSPDAETPPPGIDVAVPSIARVYDFFLDGRDNFASDRAAAASVTSTVPEAPRLAFDNRDFLRRAVRWLVGEAGIRQIVDIGSGLPTAGNVHEVAAEAADDVRVVYVDADPIVLAHGRALLAADDRTAVIQADIREHEKIFSDPATQRLIDREQPYAVLAAAILHHLADDEDPQGTIDRIKGYLRPGDYLLLSHFCDPEDDPRAKAIERALLDGGLGTGRFRTRDEQLAFFSGLELVDPGWTFANDWRADLHSPQGSPVHRMLGAGVARVP